ncbi:TerB N-terminal domain-containing protein [Salibacterium qingdaonense]|uniref:TerB N-terminal domain-containing protein n=1 Tax=Salibacterium qingdaonense TaxID=266892 RepID=UPI0024819FD5|nr:TerB N-terminal domain-containing protein [Salibacterium qingdaonense]
MKKSVKYNNRTQQQCKEIPLQAYWTTFDHLNEKQFKWYIYWRQEALKLNFMEVDLSYIILFGYELINYSFNSKAAFNVSMMVHLLENYKELHPNLEKYFSTWLADMLYELKEPELAEVWDDNQAFYRVPKLYNELHHKEADKISMNIWHKYIYNYKETKFFQEHKNKIYKTFKKSILILQSIHQENNSTLLNEWFEINQTREIRRLFTSAVVERDVDDTHIYVTSFSIKNALNEEITNLFRLSENITRRMNGVNRQIKVEEENLPSGLKEKMESNFIKGDYEETENRFQVVQQKTKEEQGSAIPAKPSENNAETENRNEDKAEVTFDAALISKTVSDTTDLVNTVEEMEGEERKEEEATNPFQSAVAYSSTENSGVPSNNETEPAFQTMFDVNDDESEAEDMKAFFSSLLYEELQFFNLFHNDVLDIADAESFIKQNNQMLNVFIAGINEKSNEHLEDNIVELDNSSIVIMEDYSDLLNEVKEEWQHEN